MGDRGPYFSPSLRPSSYQRFQEELRGRGLPSSPTRDLQVLRTPVRLSSIAVPEGFPGPWMRLRPHRDRSHPCTPAVIHMVV